MDIGHVSAIEVPVVGTEPQNRCSSHEGARAAKLHRSTSTDKHKWLLSTASAHYSQQNFFMMSAQHVTAALLALLAVCVLHVSAQQPNNTAVGVDGDRFTYQLTLLPGADGSVATLGEPRMNIVEGCGADDQVPVFEGCRALHDGCPQKCSCVVTFDPPNPTIFTMHGAGTDDATTTGLIFSCFTKLHYIDLQYGNTTKSCECDFHVYIPASKKIKKTFKHSVCAMQVTAFIICTPLAVFLCRAAHGKH